MHNLFKKECLKYISLFMAIMVVTLHIGVISFYPINQSLGVLDNILYYIFYYFQHGICRFAVPFFL